MSPSTKQRYSHGIDVTEAVTLQEQYFMVIAGLLQKNLEMTERLVRLLSPAEQHIHAHQARPVSVEEMPLPAHKEVAGIIGTAVAAKDKPAVVKSKRQG